MNQKFIVGNWKMNTTTSEAGRLAGAIVDGMAFETESPSRSVRLSPIWPSSGRSSKAAAWRWVRRTSIPRRKARSPARSARRCSSTSAASTSSSDTASAGTSWANPMRSSTRKVRVALASGLDVIFCCGETLDQRQADQTGAVLDRQLTQGLAGLSADHPEPFEHRVRTGLGDRQPRTPRHPPAGPGGARRHPGSLRSDVRGGFGPGARHPVRRQRQAG